MEKAFPSWRLLITPRTGGIREICLTKPTPLRDYSWFVFHWNAHELDVSASLSQGRDCHSSDKWQGHSGLPQPGLVPFSLWGLHCLLQGGVIYVSASAESSQDQRIIKWTEDHPVPNLLQGTALSYSYFLWVSLYLLKSYLRWQWGWDKPPSNVVKKQLEKVIFFGNDDLEDLSCLTQQFCFLLIFTVISPL